MDGSDQELDRLRTREAQLASEVDGLRQALAARESLSALDETPYRQIVQSAVDVAVITSRLDGVVTGWNAGAENIFGWKAQEMIGQSAERIFTPEDQLGDVPAQEKERAVRDGRAEDERWHMRSDGARFWATGLMMPLLDGGRHVGFLKMARDRTAQHQAMQKMLQDAAYQDLLLREVSHRVKNSLTLISGLLTMQARASRDREARDALQQAVRRVRLVADVHDRLWRYGETTTVDLRAYLSDLCEDLREQAPTHELHCDLQALEAPTDQAAPIGLLANELVTNAFKHAYDSSGGPVTMKLSADDGGPLLLEVTDEGNGLPVGFDPRHVNGSLGMRLINGLTRQLNGELSVRASDRGARFRVEIPRAS